MGSRGEGQVIGVVQDEINFTLDADAEPALFVRMENPWSGCSGSVCGHVSYVVRLGEDSPEIREAARRAIVAVNRDAVVFESATIRELLLMLIIVTAAVAGPAMRALRLSPTVAMRID